MHFGLARTKVNVTVIARMVARTFPKTPAHARLVAARHERPRPTA